jgi:hypothetical protein
VTGSAPPVPILLQNCYPPPRIDLCGPYVGSRTTILLANLAAGRPEVISVAIAGILEPALTPPERLASPPGHDAGLVIRRV